MLDVSTSAYVMFGLTLAIILVMSRVTQAVPAPLVAVVVMTVVVIVVRPNVPPVGHEGVLTDGLPGFPGLDVPVNLETLSIIWPTALSVALVGLMETLLTAKLVGEMTETRSHKSRESWALGVANIAASAVGGPGGCAMIGQTVLNVKIGRARTRCPPWSPASSCCSW